MVASELGTSLPADARPNRLILHIGPPKTGTSILQYTLAENRSRLLTQGVLYPDLRPRPTSRWDALLGEPTGVKHDYLLLLALDDPTDMLVSRRHKLAVGEELEAIRIECVDSLADELERTPAKTLLLSSESFGNSAVNPTTHLAEIAEYTKALADEVTVVMYARHPVAMARSRQQQLLKSGMNTLDELDKPWVYPYGKALWNLWRIFGRSSVHVVAYERDFNRSFDTVGSFGSLVGLDTAGWDRPSRKGNASLTMEGALLADALAREFPQPDAMAGHRHPGRARAGLVGGIAGVPFRLSDATEREVMEVSQPDMDVLADEYDIRFPDLPDGDEALWGPEAIRSVALMLNRLARNAGPS